MIDLKVEIHDKFSFEMKTSFIASPQERAREGNEFGISTWLFLPNSLDINRVTYSKKQFYRDTRSNVRLVTPVFSLESICAKDNSPFTKLRDSLEALARQAHDGLLLDDFSFQIRMFASIFKSATRDKATSLMEVKLSRQELCKETGSFLATCEDIKKQYRSLWPRLIENKELPKDAAEHFSFGDMFIGNTTEQYGYKLMRSFETTPAYEDLKPQLYRFVKDEENYKKAQAYSTLDREDSTNNYLVVMRRNILKKFIESDLFLDTKKSKDGAWAEQLGYAVAASLSMIFATIIAFSAQHYYGNFTLPLFIALVISYAFKDRIKETMRYYLSSQLGKKYFDAKRKLEIQKQEIGWTKESFDFVSESKIPEKVMGLRKRTPLVEAENKVFHEKIILHRKLVNLFYEQIDGYKGYPFVGVNDITRYNLVNFIRKMDNAFVPLHIPHPQHGYEAFQGERVYALHLIIRCESRSNIHYRKFRILLNREGIKEIREIEENQQKNP